MKGEVIHRVPVTPHPDDAARLQKKFASVQFPRARLRRRPVLIAESPAPSGFDFDQGLPSLLRRQAE
jgi:hypothetical protein